MKMLKDQARSIGAKLSAVAKKLNVPYQKILTEFLLERLVVRLNGNPELSQYLIFKGGYVSLRVYDSPRYTIDLDALLKQGDLKLIAQSAQMAAEVSHDDAVWFRLEKTSDLKTQGEDVGLRLSFRAGIGEVLKDVRIAQLINLDIGKGDPITPPPVEIETPFILGGGYLSWKVYPAETIVSEKLHALLTRGDVNSRSKDIFDLNLLLPKCDPERLKKSLQQTFHYRGDKLPNEIIGTLKQIDRTLLKMGWISAIKDIVNAPSCDEAFDSLIKKLSAIL